MSNDLWRTPKELFNTLNREFSFAADMASSDENRLCMLNYTEVENSLSFNWHKEVNSGVCTEGNKYVWCNPPYSNPLPWVNKALEAQKDGLGVVMLLNNDMSITWFARALIGVSEIRCIVATKTEGSRTGYKPGRIDFLDGKGNPMTQNNKPQFILVFNPFKIGANVTSYIKKADLMGDL